jgi:hypothetical protein
LTKQAFTQRFLCCLRPDWRNCTGAQWRTMKAGQRPGLLLRSSKGLFLFPYPIRAYLGGCRVGDRLRAIILRFVGLRTRYPVLKICPTAFCIGLTTVSGSEYYVMGKGLGRSQIEKGQGGVGREGRMTVPGQERKLSSNTPYDGVGLWLRKFPLAITLYSNGIRSVNRQWYDGKCFG